MNQREFQEGLERLVAGELTPEEVEDFAADAQDDPRQAAELQALQGLESLTTTAFRHVETPEGFVDRVLFRLNETEERTVTEVLEAARDSEVPPPVHRSKKPPRPGPPKRSRTGWLILAGVVAAALMLALVMLRPDESSRQTPETLFCGSLRGDNIAGTVEYRQGGGDWEPAPPGSALPVGSEIRVTDRSAGVELMTVDAGHRATVLFKDGAHVVVHGPERLEVARGQAYMRVYPRSRRPPFVIDLAEAQVNVVGTSLAVSRDESEARIVVESGRVDVRARGSEELGPPQRVRAGQEGLVVGRKVHLRAHTGRVAPWRFPSEPEPDATEPRTPPASTQQPVPARPPGPHAAWTDDRCTGTLAELVDTLRERWANPQRIQLEVERQELARHALDFPAQGLSECQVLSWAARFSGLQLAVGHGEDEKTFVYTLRHRRELLPSELRARQEDAAGHSAANSGMGLPAQMRNALVELTADARPLAEAVDALAAQASVSIFVDERHVDPERTITPVGGRNTIEKHLRAISGQVEGVAVPLDGAFYLTSWDEALLHLRVPQRHPASAFAKPDKVATGRRLQQVGAWLAEVGRGPAGLGRKIGPFEVLAAGDEPVIDFAATRRGHLWLSGALLDLRGRTPPGHVPEWLLELQNGPLARHPVGGLSLTPDQELQDVVGRFSNETGAQIRFEPACRVFAPMTFRPTGQLRWEHCLGWIAAFTHCRVRLEPECVIFGSTAPPGAAGEGRMAAYDLAAIPDRHREQCVEAIRAHLSRWPRLGRQFIRMILIDERLLVYGDLVSQSQVSQLLDSLLDRLAAEPEHRFLHKWKPAAPAWYAKIQDRLDRRQLLGPQTYDDPAAALLHLGRFVPLVMAPQIHAPAPRPAAFEPPAEPPADQAARVTVDWNGSVRELLDRVCDAQGLRWSIRLGAVYVEPAADISDDAQ